MGKIVPSLDKTCIFGSKLCRTGRYTNMEVQMYLCLALMMEINELKGLLANKEEYHFLNN